jgi:hypothetical protein
MRIGVAPERWLAIFMVACALCCTGCSLIGLGIGAASPRWERNVPPEEIESYRVEGKPPDVDVQLGTPAHPEPWWVAGSFVRLSADGKTRPSSNSTGTFTYEYEPRTLVVATDANEWGIPLQDIERVDVRRGSYWATGLGVGFALDVAAALVTAVLIGTLEGMK